MMSVQDETEGGERSHGAHQRHPRLRLAAETDDGRPEDHPQETAVSLDPLPGVEDRPESMGEVGGVAIGDVRVIAHEPQVDDVRRADGQDDRRHGPS